MRLSRRAKRCRVEGREAKMYALLPMPDIFAEQRHTTVRSRSVIGVGFRSVALNEAGKFTLSNAFVYFLDADSRDSYS